MGVWIVRTVMDKRCDDCKVEDKLRNLLVLRHVILARKYGRDTIEEENCTAHDNTRKSIDSDTHLLEPKDSGSGDFDVFEAATDLTPNRLEIK
jgi:hypothetical protein